MRPKRLISALLLLFVIGSVGFLLVQEYGSSGSAPSVENTGGVKKGQVIAYYFHGKARCVTCQRLEAYAEEALETGFPREFADGRLKFHIVDTSLPENRHFITDYQIRFQSLILVEIKDGQQQRWRNLDQIWQKVRDKAEYIAYVQDEISRFLVE